MQYQKFAIVINSHKSPGSEISEYLLEQGFYVWGVGKDECKIVHSRFSDIITDLKDEYSVEAMFDIIRESSDEIHLLINSPSDAPSSPIEEISTSEYSSVINESLIGTFHILKHIKPFLAEGETFIIDISNVTTTDAFETFAVECSSQSAKKSLLEVCSKEWNNIDIKFSNIIFDNLKTNYNDGNIIKELLESINAVLHAPRHIDLSKLLIKKRREQHDWQ